MYVYIELEPETFVISHQFENQYSESCRLPPFQNER